MSAEHSSKDISEFYFEFNRNFLEIVDDVHT